MIQLFRKNWFVFTLLLFPYAILTRLWIFFGDPVWPINIDDQSLVYQYIHQFFPGTYVWNVILGCFILFIDAVILNRIVIQNRISREINLFPGMLLILFSALHKEMFWTSPQLIAITFLLLAISNIFRVYQKPNASIFIFNAGFFSAIATLIYIPYIFFVIFVFVSILVLRKMDVRDFIQVISGFILPFFFVHFIRYWNTGTVKLFKDFNEQMIINFKISGMMINDWIIIAFIILLLVLSFNNYRKFTIKKSIQSQKKVNLFYWFLIIAFISLLFSLDSFFMPGLQILFISFAVFIAMLMSRTRNEAAMEIIHLFFLFFVIFSHFWF